MSDIDPSLNEEHETGDQQFEHGPAEDSEEKPSEKAQKQILEVRRKFANAKKRKNTYAYKNIDYNNQIRLLKIYPGAKRDSLACSLIPCRLLDHEVQRPLDYTGCIPYGALSYSWGVNNARNVVHVFDSDDGYETWKKVKSVLKRDLRSQFFVRDNLRDALEQLRSKEKAVFVWADAICINQENLTERTAQVARMHDVYTQAEKVYIWLGKGKSKEENQKTFNFLTKILDLGKLEQIIGNIERKEIESTWRDDQQDCKRVIDLMKAEWFSRRWVIQELALATNAHVHRGECTMMWTEFADAIALFMTKYESIRRSFERPKDYKASRESDDHHYALLDARALGANALVTTTSNLFRRSSEGRILKRLLSLEVLVSSMLLAFEALDPRDTVFAVLKISKDNSKVLPRRLSSSNVPAIHILYLLPYIGIGMALWGPEGTTLLHTSLIRTIISEFSFTKMIWSSRAVLIIINTISIVVVSTLLISMLLRKFYDFSRRLFDYIAPGIFRSGEQVDQRIEANYRKCLRDVCIDFIAYCIETSGSLDILCRHWAPAMKPSTNGVNVMPSWVLPITGHAFGGPEQSRIGRVNGDSLVGASDRIGRYSASGHRLPEVKFGETKAVREKITEIETEQTPGQYTTLPPEQMKEFPPRFDGTLRVKGMRLGVVEQTESVAGHVITSAALELCGWSKGSGTDDLDHVWRILVANRGPNGSNPPDWYRRACKACLEWYNLQPEDHFNTNDLKNLPGTPGGKVEFLDRVQQVVYNRNIIRVGQTGGPDLICVAPKQSQRNDLVCILFGCSVPVVLQQQTNRRFKFIGECYVHGKMDGEAVDPVSNTGREQWFELE